MGPWLHAEMSMSSFCALIRTCAWRMPISAHQRLCPVRYEPKQCSCSWLMQHRAQRQAEVLCRAKFQVRRGRGTGLPAPANRTRSGTLSLTAPSGHNSVQSLTIGSGFG